MENEKIEKKENKLKKFVLDNRGAICMGVGIAIGTVLGGTVIMNKYADAIKLDTLYKKSVPWEEGLPGIGEVLLEYWSNADIWIDRPAVKNTPITMLTKEAESIIEYAKGRGHENAEIVGTILFAKKADS